jgi:hypothetical protein
LFIDSIGSRLALIQAAITLVPVASSEHIPPAMNLSMNGTKLESVGSIEDTLNEGAALNRSLNKRGLATPAAVDAQALIELEDEELVAALGNGHLSAHDDEVVVATLRVVEAEVVVVAHCVRACKHRWPLVLDILYKACLLQEGHLLKLLVLGYM